MSDFHGRMMNLQIDKERAALADRTHKEVLAYKSGHRDARHAAAEIALEADRQLEAAAEKITQAEALFTAFVAESDARAQAAFEAWEKQVAQLNAKIRALLGQATAAKEMAEALRSIAHHVDPNSADGTYRYDSASDACDFAFSRASEALAAWTAAKEGR